MGRSHLVHACALGAVTIATAALAAAALLLRDGAWEAILRAAFRWPPSEVWGLGVVASVVFLALLVRLEGPAAPGWRQVAARVVAVFLLLGASAVWDLRDFHRLNVSEAYRIQRRPGTLAELVDQMPDRYHGSRALLWLNRNAMHSTIVGTDRTLGSAELAPHRLAAIAQVDVQVVAFDPVLPRRLAGPEAAARRVRVNPGTDQSEVWIEQGPLPPVLLCAVPLGESGVLLVRAGSPKECAVP